MSEDEPRQSLFEMIMTKINQDSVIINTNKYVEKDFTIDDCLRSLSNYGRTRDFVSVNEERSNLIERLIIMSERQLPQLNTETKIEQQPLSGKDPQEVIDNLYVGYFSPMFDPTYSQMVHVLSWDLHDNHENKRNERFMQAIEKAEVERDMVDHAIKQMIKKNSSTISSSEETIVEIRKDLHHALKYINIARLSNDATSNILHQSYLKVAQLMEQKEHLITTESLLLNFQLFSNLRKSAHAVFDKGDLLLASQCYLSLLRELTSINLYSEFEVVRAIKRKIVEDLPMLHSKCNKMLELICSRRFNPSDPTQYSQLIQSYVIFEQMRGLLSHIFNNTNTSPTSSPSPSSSSSSSSPNTPISFSSSLSSSSPPPTPSIQRIISSKPSTKDLPRAIFSIVCNDICYCARSAVLEGIYTATDAVGHHNTHIHLAELPIDKLVQHITQSCYLDCILRSTELITMSIDTYNEITKWHQTTSQEPNHENKEAMFDIGMKLQEKKILIWDRAEQCLISILKSLIPTPAMPLNDFETIERIIGKFNLLGSLGRVSEVSTLHMRMKEISTLYYSKKERWNAEKKRLDKDIHAKEQEKAIKTMSF